MQAFTQGPLVAAFLLAGAPAPGELHVLSRNSVVFVDGRAEWSPYRVCDELSPVTWRVEGPAAVRLRVRTFSRPGLPPPDAIGVLLLDERIVRTVRVPALAEEGLRFADVAGERPALLVLYSVPLPAGSHRLTLRYSEGPPLLVSALLEPTELGEDGLPPPPSPGIARVDAESSLPVDTATQAARVGPEVPEPVAAAEVAALAPPTRIPLPPSAPDLPRPAPLTVPAPYLGFDLGLGLSWSRWVRAPGPSAALRVHLPPPGLDARRHALALGLHVHLARSGDVARGGGGEALALGTVERRALGLELSFTTRLLGEGEGVDLYGRAGGVLELGRLEVDLGERRVEQSTLAGVGRLGLGAALGPLGRRPFLELALGLGRLAGEQIRDGGAAFVELQAQVGYQVDLLTDAVVLGGSSP